MKNMILAFFVFCAASCLAATETVDGITWTYAVSNVSAKPAYPWNRVAVTFTASGVATGSNLAALGVATNTAGGAALASFTLCKVPSNGVYTVLWDAGSVLGTANAIETMKVGVWLEKIEGVQLWEGGPYWAERNIGAENPWDSGYYFWWGDTVGYRRVNNSWVASNGSNSNFSFESYNTPTDGLDASSLYANGWTDSSGNLASAHDAAHVHWGKGWRMPTLADMENLVNNTTTSWITTNGVSGRLVRGKGAYASASIFLPAAGDGYGSSLYGSGSHGDYWSSTPSPDYARQLYFNSDRFVSNSGYRDDGQSVRPLREFADDGSQTYGDFSWSNEFAYEPMGTSVMVQDEPVVSNVTAKLVYPWNRITVTFTASGVDSGADLTACAVATNTTGGAALALFTLCKVPSNGTYTVLWDAESALGTANAVESMKVGVWLEKPEGVQLWANGPYWAERNIGAENPWDSGYYFWWGDTVGYKRVNNAWVASDGSNSSFSFGSGNTPTYGRDASSLYANGWTDSSGNLASANDAAQVHWGKGWRMPTWADMQNLVNNTTTSWITINGVNGRLVCGKGAYASASIFLPAAGYGNGSSLYYSGSYGFYWSSTPDSGSSDCAGDLRFSSGSVGWYDNACRDGGWSVRPLREFAGDGKAACAVLWSNEFSYEPVSASVAGENLKPIEYDPAWFGAGTCSLAIDGQAVLTATEAGEYVWWPTATGSHTLMYRARANAMNKTIVLTSVAEPTVLFSVPDMSVVSGSQKMVLTYPADENATIYYTADGTTPTTASSVFTKPFKVSPYVKIQAFAVSQTFGTSAVTKCELGEGICADVAIDSEDGTLFEASAKVTLTCATEGATIYYTTDGSDPTMESSVFTRAFRVSPMTTVKAWAYKEDWIPSGVSSSTMALGEVVTPVVTPGDGEIYYASNTLVTISTVTSGATIHYTLDGSEPTVESAVYAGPFPINGDVTVRAMAVKEDFFDSEVASASLTRGWYVVGTPAISADATFAAATAMVEISCPTNGATLYYTLDGSAPTRESATYTKPIKVSETTTVKAFAVKDDYLDSGVAEFTVTKVWTMGDSLNAHNLGFTSESAQPWTVVTDETKDGVEALKSGNPGNDGESVVSAVVTNGGMVAFWWKSSCEDDEDPATADWDHLEFRVDGVVRAFLDGETDWTLVTVDVTGDGEHTLEWAYKKDDSWSDGQDCGWLDLVAWSPSDGSGATQTTEAAVPYSWLDEKGLGELVGVDYEMAAKSLTGKRDGAGRALTVMDDFVMGTDPAKADDLFMASITVVDGNPVISWTPELPEAEAAKRKYTIFGKSNLSDADWSEVAGGEEGDYNFFKVTVEMR